METYSANEIIEIAVQIERSGYEYYQQALKHKHLNEETQKLLESLSNQEKMHEQIFMKMRDEQDKISLDEVNSWEAVSSFFKAIVQGRLFNDPQSAIRKAQESKSKEELLNNALLFEKDTLLYYHSLRSVVEDEHIKDTLEKIIVEEMSHIVRLSLFVDKM